MLGTKKEPEKGITLLEVLIALVIVGIIVSLILRLFVDQLRFSSEFRTRMELQYSITRAVQVLTDEIKKAREIEWSESGKLKLTLCSENGFYDDFFYIADKDFDGRPDLYREHFSVPNPVATGIKELSCREVKNGLWEITLRAGGKNQEITWNTLIRQRVSLK